MDYCIKSQKTFIRLSCWAELGKSFPPNNNASYEYQNLYEYVLFEKIILIFFCQSKIRI